MGYLGNDLKVAYSTYKNIDDISGSFNGSTTSFSLLVGGVAPSPLPLNSQQCLISVGGVVQRPDDTGSEGFRLSGGNIVFSSAPGTGEDFFGVILAGADYVNVGANFPSGSAAVPSITFDSDLDTGIYNSAANQVSIATAGTERLRIDSAGQIESVSLGSASAPAFSFTTDPNTGIYAPGADQVAISTNGTRRFQVSSDGTINVFGANKTPSGGGNSVIYATDTQAVDVGGSIAFGGYYIGTSSDTEWAQIAGRKENSTSGNYAGYLQFSTRANGGSTTERARIDSSGRLLVGTSSASGGALLQVNGGATVGNISTLSGTTGSIGLNATATIITGIPAGAVYQVTAMTGDNNTDWFLVAYVGGRFGTSLRISQHIASNVDLTSSGADLLIRNLSSTAVSFSWTALRIK